MWRQNGEIIQMCKIFAKSDNFCNLQRAPTFLQTDMPEILRFLLNWSWSFSIGAFTIGLLFEHISFKPKFWNGKFSAFLWPCSRLLWYQKCIAGHCTKFVIFFKVNHFVYSIAMGNVSHGNDSKWKRQMFVC